MIDRIRIKPTPPNQIESLLPDQRQPRPGCLPNGMRPSRNDKQNELYGTGRTRHFLISNKSMRKRSTIAHRKTSP